MTNSIRTLLSPLKASEIRNLAFLTGLDSSATKTHLLDRLPDLLATSRLPKTRKSTLRILSVDMGIRNLAYCVLDVPRSVLAAGDGVEIKGVVEAASVDVASEASVGTKKQPKKMKKAKEVQSSLAAALAGLMSLDPSSSTSTSSTPPPSPPPPSALKGAKLIAWRRTAISNETLNASPAPSTATTTIKPTISASSPSSSTTPPHPSPSKKDTFSPPHFAPLAYTLLRHTLLPYAPDVILIERQRYRSAGSPAILEWTVRVNMFESMLWAVLETLRREGMLLRADGGGGGGAAGPVDGEKAAVDDMDMDMAVYPVNPKKVTGFWTAAAATTTTTTTTTTTAAADTDTDTDVDSTITAPTLDSPDAKDEKSKKKEAKSSKAVKEAKIAIAEAWVRGSSSGGLKCAKEAMVTKRAFLRAFLRARGRRKKGGGVAVFAEQEGEDADAEGDGAGEEDGAMPEMVGEHQTGGKMSKLDDLADCLLQGVAWVQWEVNRRRISKVLDEAQGRGEFCKDNDNVEP